MALILGVVVVRDTTQTQREKDRHTAGEMRRVSLARAASTNTKTLAQQYALQ